MHGPHARRLARIVAVAALAAGGLVGGLGVGGATAQIPILPGVTLPIPTGTTEPTTTTAPTTTVTTTATTEAVPPPAETVTATTTVTTPLPTPVPVPTPAPAPATTSTGSGAPATPAFGVTLGRIGALDLRRALARRFRVPVRCSSACTVILRLEVDARVAKRFGVGSGRTSVLVARGTGRAGTSARRLRVRATKAGRRLAARSPRTIAVLRVRART